MNCGKEIVINSIFGVSHCCDVIKTKRFQVGLFNVMWLFFLGQNTF